MKNKSVLVGWLALFVSIALFSTVEIVGKKINFKADVDPFTMVFLRFFLTVFPLLGHPDLLQVSVIGQQPDQSLRHPLRQLRRQEAGIVGAPRAHGQLLPVKPGL